jgi:SNF2 family DNA or RNA helicase
MKTPYPFQTQAIQAITESPGFLLCDECGLGKTLQAIEIAKATRKTTAGWQCLVITPPVLIPQWKAEIEGQDPGQLITIVNRMPLDYASLSGYILMSIYDLTSAIVRQPLFTHLFDMTIVDEAHRIKNRKTKTAMWIKQIPAARRLCLTGTPMEKNPADLWSLLNYVAPDDFPAYWGFVMTHLQVTEGYFEKYVVGGAKNPARFGELLRPYMLRRTKVQVAPQLPERIDILQQVALGEEQGALYDEVRHQKDILVTAGGQEFLIQNALVLLTRLQQISAWPPLLGFEGVPSGKLDWLHEFLLDHPDDRVVIFTRFRNLAIYLAVMLDCDIIIGGRKEMSAEPKVLVGTIDAMGEGLNLGWAKHAIFLDSHWSTIRMSQALDRIHRIDIKEPKNVYMLFSTLEDKLVLDALANKWSEAELVYHFIDTL